MPVVSRRDGSLHVEVADGDSIVGSTATLDADERSHIVCIGSAAEGQRVAPSVEVTAELMISAACHAGDGLLCRADVVAHLYVLANKAVPYKIVLKGIAEGVPSVNGADDIGIVF